jgi:8-oxo-dGTP diphosphatase
MNPFHLVFHDDQYPIQGQAHTRPNARAFLQNEAGLFCFNHIVALDKFGHRDYLETPGGGLNDGESPEVGLVRELEEEVGVKTRIITNMGLIEDDYHLIHRHNLNYYFYAQVIGTGSKAWTEQEFRLIKAQPWLTLAEALRWYESLPNTGIAKLIKQREIPPLKWLQAYLRLRK